jgi:hypothetical protein
VRSKAAPEVWPVGTEEAWRESGGVEEPAPLSGAVELGGTGEEAAGFVIAKIARNAAPAANLRLCFGEMARSFIIFGSI